MRGRHETTGAGLNGTEGLRYVRQGRIIRVYRKTDRAHDECLSETSAEDLVRVLHDLRIPIAPRPE